MEVLSEMLASRGDEDCTVMGVDATPDAAIIDDDDDETAVDADVGLPSSVHCKYGRLDFGRGRSTAVANIRAHANVARSFALRLCGKCVVHTDRLHGFVFGPGDSLLVSRGP